MASSNLENPKEIKKMLKKLNRFRENMLNREKVVSVDFATMMVCVCNGGLDNNVTYEEMLALFGAFSSKCDVIMIPQKSYAFVCYTSLEESAVACKQLNGFKLAPTENRNSEVILYTLFVKEVPDSISPSKDRPLGLILLDDAVSVEYAAEIMKSVNWEDQANEAQQNQLKHRRVKHYGYEFKYNINNVDPDDPLSDHIPDVYRSLLDKLLYSGAVKHYPDQLTINQYQPGQGIPPHVDTPSAFEDGLISLSLGSPVLMEFRHPDGRHLSVLLPHRSVLIMTGESRYIWSHGITPRKSDIVSVCDGGLTLSQRGVRTSFTFRKITGVKPAQEHSDKPSVPCDDNTASQLEHLHVYQVYEEIADHFSGTRHTPWPNIAEFLKQQHPGSLLADIGCGNGKYLGINKDLYEIGSDRSYNLAKIVQERNYQVYVGDVLSIPLRHNVFDVCLCIAVIHHLSTQERRRRAVSELLKILQPGGKALIYVWAMEQELNKVKSKYLKKGKLGVEGETLRSGDRSNGSETEGLKSSRQFDEHDESNCATCVHDRTKSASGGIADKPTEDIFDNGDNGKNTGDQIRDASNGSKGTVEKYADTEKISDQITSTESDIGQDQKSIEENQAPVVPPKLEVHVNRTQFKQQDLLVPWQQKSKDKNSDRGNTFHRFYHVFYKGELEELCESVPICKVIKSFYDQGNWAVILEKL